MRLCVVSHPCFTAVNRRVYSLIAERGVEVLIIVPERLGGRTADPRQPRDPPICYLPLSSENPRSYNFLGSGAVISRFAPDVIILEADPVSALAVRLGVWCRFHSAKLFCLSVENLDFGLLPHIQRTGITSAPQIAVKLMLNVVSRVLVDIVFTICDAGSVIFERHGYRDVRQVPLGFDPSVFRVDGGVRSRTRVKFGASNDTVVLAYFGRITPQKGVHILLEALRIIAPELRGLDWRILIDDFQSVDGYSSEIFEQISRSDLSGHVVKIEADHLEIAEYMMATDVVFLPSVSTPRSVEQYGRTIPEAMACGALAIVSDAGTPKELVGEYGLVFPEGDVLALARIIKAVVLDMGGYKDLAERGAAHASATLTIDRQAGCYLSALGL